MRFSPFALVTMTFSLAFGLAVEKNTFEKRSASGQATSYGGNLAGGTCSFSTYTLPSGVLGTALSDSNWDSAGNCGACLEVTGPGGKKTLVMVVDQCPGCGMNHLDLFPNAFTSLANIGLGTIDVTWNIVDCPITSPMQLHNKAGVSQWYFSMQVVNANKQVVNLEASPDSGKTWIKPDNRTNDNFFLISKGTGSSVVDVRVTANDGSMVTAKNVPVTPNSVFTAPSNFGSSGSAAAAAAPVSSSPASSATSTVRKAAQATSTTSTASSATSSPAGNGWKSHFRVGRFR